MRHRPDFDSGVARRPPESSVGCVSTSSATPRLTPLHGEYRRKALRIRQTNGVDFTPDRAKADSIDGGVLLWYGTDGLLTFNL
jgi:hypothetical protein